MLDFENLLVYQKAQSFNREIQTELLESAKVDRIVKDQLRRASMSIQLNIAEGCSRFSKEDRKNFFVIARGSAFECVAIFDLLLGNGNIEKLLREQLAKNAEEISKMLFALIRNLKNSRTP